MGRLFLIAVGIGGAVWIFFALFTTANRPRDQAKQPPSLSELSFETVSYATTPEAPTPTIKITTPMSFDQNKSYTATLSTAKGDIVIALNAAGTPKTAENFVTLARKKFYDGTIFHRTIKGFMIQGGDPLGTGTGGPGYKFDDEPFQGEYIKGTVAMANSGPNTNGSQFFIMHGDVPLEKNYVIFGKVLKGMEVVDATASAPVMFANGEKSKPVEPVTVTAVTINEQ